MAFNLLTQNSDLRKGGIYGWSLPAHWVTLPNGDRFNTCPNAGVCGAFCYAKNGTYQFPEVKKAHIDKLMMVLFHRDKWKRIMIYELQKPKYYRKYIRIHDAGDFFSESYAKDWIDIINYSKNCKFYTYTKEVELFKCKLKDSIPSNLTIIYSFGGKQDNMIDKDKDRHSDVFPDYNDMINAGYFPMGDDDKEAAINTNHRIGLYRNNIPHFIKKMGNKKFSEWSKSKNKIYED